MNTGHITNDIGRVIPLHKGEYSATTPYELNDCVSFQGSTYWHYEPEETIGALPTDETVWRLMTNATDVEPYVERALQAAEDAEEARDEAEEAQTAAESAKTAAQTSASSAELAAGRAESAQDATEDARDDAESARDAAQIAKTNAEAAKTDAEAAQTAAETAQAGAEAAKTNALASATAAYNSEQSTLVAKTAAETAKTAAQSAQTAAETAKTNAESAQTAAEAAQTAAETAQDEAETAQAEAATSAQDAQESAEDAEAYAVGKRAGVDVPETDPAHNNNAKYYAEQAETTTQAVKYVEQTLTDSQKAQARENIEAASPSGYYADAGLGSATAENLIDTKATGTPREFTFDTACGDASITDDGTATIDEIKGNTIKWNQLVALSNLGTTGTQNGVTYTNNGDGSWTISGTATAGGSREIVRNSNGVGLIRGHKYLALCNPSDKSQLGALDAKLVWWGVGASGGFYGQDVGDGIVFTHETENEKIYCYFYVYAEKTVNLTIYPQLVDITESDFTYAEFRKLFPLNYYAHDEGRLLNFNGTGIESVGFNQFDEETVLLGIGFSKTSEGYGITPPYAITGNKLYENKTGYTGRMHIVYDVKYGSAGTGIYFVFAYTDGTTSTVYPSSTTDWQHKELTSTEGKIVDYIRFGISASVYTTFKNICINFSWSGYRNGEYEEYWKRTLSLPVSTYFPTGMKLAGTAHDSLFANRAMQRIGAIDLGTLDYTALTAYFYASIPLMKKITDGNTKGNIVCVRYDTKTYNNIAYVPVQPNKSIGCIFSTAYGNTMNIYIVDNDYQYTSVGAAELKASLSGVILYFELDEPVETPISPALNLSYKVTDFGTEKLLPENDDEPTTSPFLGIIKYSTDFPREIANLPKNYISRESMQNFITALGMALNKTITMTYDDESRVFEFTITDNGGEV